MDDLSVEKTMASEGEAPSEVAVVRPDGRILRRVGPESEVGGGPEAASEPAIPDDDEEIAR